MGKQQLHIPGPEGVDDRSDMYLAFLAAVLLFALFGVLLFRADSRAEKRAPNAEPVASHDAPPEDPMQVELKAQRARSEQLAKLSPADLAAMDWSKEDQRVAFRFGPRAATEAICQKNTAQLVDGTFPSSMTLELEKSIDRRTEFAPWTCLSRLHFADRLPEGALKREVAEFWTELESHEGNARIPVSVLTDFRESRDRPEAPAFYRWLRGCALDFAYEAHSDCQRLLRQISPAQGGDMLEMLEKHWAEGEIRAQELPKIISAVGHLARNGQPHNWRVQETKQLPDYDVDFRQAAVGYLCRMVNTPTPNERDGVESSFDEVPALASEELRRVGQSGARAYEERLLMRWRETCRLAFGGLGGYREGEERVGVPLLAVWTGETDAAADFSIASATRLGTCKPSKGYPSWYCLAQNWRGEGMTLDRAVAHFFVETRYMEWDDAFKTEKKPAPATEESAP